MKTYRNYISFWILGLSNNYAYVIMLSAAYDMLHPTPITDNSEQFDCNTISTGAVLLADIVPCLLIKLLAPFLFKNTNLRVIFVVLFSALSFILPSFASGMWMTYLGIICASLSSGLGETTFLTHASNFDSPVISWWSSGTGFSGLLGSISYASLTTLGLSPRSTLLVMLVIPCAMAFTFWCLLEPRINHVSNDCSSPLLNENNDENVDEMESNSIVQNDNSSEDLTYREMLTQTKSLLKYMIPLMLVYFFEYFINQGLFELVYFKKIFLTHSEQYRWYLVDYQIGVLISRSSISLVKIHRIYILSVLQFLNVVIILIHILYPILPSIWVMLAIVLFEGLLGGSAYVNTFDRIFREVDQKYKGFSMSVTVISDSLGITFAGISALPTHDYLCNLINR